MSGASAFFILIPAMYLLFTVALGTIALTDRRLVAARWAALGFFIAFCSILVDGYRDPGGDRWVSWFTVATHFLPLLVMIQAFLSRHGRHTPRWAIGLTVFGCVYIMPDMPWAPPHGFRGVFVQLVCTAIIASGLPALWRIRRTPLDLLAFGVILLAALSYAGRSAVIYLNPIGESDAEVLAFYDGLNLIFHSASALMGMSVGIVLMLTIGYDMVMNRTRESEIDALTGLGNRRALDRRIAVHEAGRRMVGAVLVVDLDHFKRVNDRYGHEAGDDVLRAVGVRMRGLFASGANVCRTGGEEFVILLDTGHRERVAAMAIAVRKAIAGLHFDGPMARARVTASVGFHACEAGETVPEAIARADQAVYCAKTNGRDRVVGAVNSNGLNVLRDVA